MSIWSTDTHNKLKTWKKGLIFVGEKWEQKKNHYMMMMMMNNNQFEMGDKVKKNPKSFHLSSTKWSDLSNRQLSLHLSNWCCCCCLWLWWWWGRRTEIFNLKHPKHIYTYDDGQRSQQDISKLLLQKKKFQWGFISRAQIM